MDKTVSAKALQNVAVLLSDAIKDVRDTYILYENKRNTSRKINYYESVQRMAAIRDTLDVLQIPHE